MHVNREFFVCLSTSSASDVANLQRSAHDTQGQSAQACRPTHDAADGLEFGNAGNSVARCPINASRQRCLRILRASQVSLFSWYAAAGSEPRPNRYCIAEDEGHPHAIQRHSVGQGCGHGARRIVRESASCHWKRRALQRRSGRFCARARAGPFASQSAIRVAAP